MNIINPTSKDYFLKILSVFCLLSIGYISFLEIIPELTSVVLSYFTEDYLKKSYLNESIENIMFIHTALMSLLVLLLSYSILFKRLNLISFTFLILIAFLTPFYILIDLHFNNFLSEAGIYKFFKKNGSNLVNPQYARILLFSILIVALSGVSLFKKQRTIDRSFVLIISTVCLTVMFLFHLAIPMGLLKYTKLERLGEFGYSMYNMNQENFCKNKDCFIYSKKTKTIVNANIPSDRVVLNNDIYNRLNSYISVISNNERDDYFDYDGDFIGTKTTFYGCINREDDVFCAIDNSAMRHYGQYAQLWFAFLTSTAHFVWIFLGIGMLFLHKKKKVHKIFNPSKN